METPTIKIDTDKKCTQCGEAGTVNDGDLCMKCATKYALEMLVGDHVVAAIHKQVDDLIGIYCGKINSALKLNGNELVVTFAVSLQTFQNKQVNVTTAISFTSEKIKDKTETATVQEGQTELFAETAE